MTPDPGRRSPPATSSTPWVAVVLAGGTSRRWGGVDKTAVSLAGIPLLVHAVRSVLPEAQALAVVAPPDHPARAAIDAEASRAGRTLVWTREQPPGGGPVAGLAAGVRALPPPPEPSPAAPSPSAPSPAEPSPAEPERWVAVLAGDHPFSRTAWPRLLAAVQAAAGTAQGSVDGAIGVTADGHRQPLLAVYAERALRARLSAVARADAPLRVVTSGLRLVAVLVSAVEALDLDTAEDAERAERIIAEA